MDFAKQTLQQSTPQSLADVELPRRKKYHPSPTDWRHEVLYFLLVDRFSDAKEGKRPLLDRSQLKVARGPEWRWDLWAESGAHRWQGGNLAGVTSKLDYLNSLGVTTLWLSPVFKQRANLDTFHGYGIQNFLEVDPGVGTREELVKLVEEAHKRDMRIILDIIFNHSGHNWNYPGNHALPPYQPFPHRYEFGHWLGTNGEPISSISNLEDGIFPQELQSPQAYTRAGFGNLGGGSVADPFAEGKRTDFFTLRDFDLDAPNVLSFLAKCYKYWIALTDCDGFRIDTLKHVAFEHARNFCGTIKEFAANLGKDNFFLIGEIAGGDSIQDMYLDAVSRNLDAALDIGEMRINLNRLAKGLGHPADYFGGFSRTDQSMGSHRNLGNKHVSILDDHDHVFGDKIRFSSEAASEHQIVAGVAIQLFTLGVPCIYYGTEQALAGPEPAERKWLPAWKGQDHADRYLREAMFGPEHPRGKGLHRDEQDEELPGFGAFGTAGYHVFDRSHPAYIRIRALAQLRRQLPVLRTGRQYMRDIAPVNRPFGVYGGGEIIAWARVLDDEEVIIIVNVHGVERRGGKVMVDSRLSTPGKAMTVLASTMEAAGIPGPLRVRTEIPIEISPEGTAFIRIEDLGPSEVCVVSNIS